MKGNVREIGNSRMGGHLKSGRSCVEGQEPAGQIQERGSIRVYEAMSAKKYVSENDRKSKCGQRGERYR